MIKTEFFRGNVREPFQRALQDFHRVCGHSLLRTKNSGRAVLAEQWILHINRGRNSWHRQMLRLLNLFAFKQYSDRGPQLMSAFCIEKAKPERSRHSKSAIVRRASAQSNKNFNRAVTVR